MHDIYAALADALRARLAVIADRGAYERDPGAHLEQLRIASERIAAAHAALPKPIDSQLAHYLERSSYDKALAFVEERLSGGAR
jgi:hypothetical protein